MQDRVLFLAGRSDFPDGDAGSKRVGLLARCLAEANFDVDLKITSKVTDSAQSVGRYCDVDYEYLEKSVSLNRSFLSRLEGLIGLSSCWRTYVSLDRVFSSGKYDYLFIYTRDVLLVLLAYVLKKRYRVPLIVDLCEWPIYSTSSNLVRSVKKTLFCTCSVKLADAFIPISTAIDAEIHKRAKRPIRSLRIPIMCDSEDFLHLDEAPLPYFSFSGGAGYPDILEFLVDSFAGTEYAKENFTLMLIGIAPDHDVVKALRVRAERLGIADKLVFPGFVTWDEYKRLLSSATAHLLSLPSDQRSTARFPNKIAEYLATGRPVICSGVGDVTLYVADKQSAFVVPGETSKLFAEHIDYVASNPKLAAQVGLEGRQVAQEVFDYRRHSKALAAFIRSL